MNNTVTHLSWFWAIQGPVGRLLFIAGGMVFPVLAIMAAGLASNWPACALLLISGWGLCELGNGTEQRSPGLKRSDRGH